MDKPLSIGMLSARFYPVQAGAEAQCRRLSSKLIQAGHKAFVITQRLGKTRKFDLVDNIPVMRVGLPFQGPAGSFLYLLSSLRVIIKKYAEIDILHAHIAAAPAVAAALLTKLTGIPSVVKFAGGRATGDIAVSLKTLIGRKKLGFIRDNTSAFVCPSEEIAGELREYGFAPEKINIIPNGIDTSAFSPAGASEKTDIRLRLGLDPASTIVIYCGRFHKGKGLETLVDIWKAVESRLPRGAARLVLLGSGMMEEELRDRAAGLKTIDFPGWRENTSDFLRAADIFIFPSHGEGMPNALLEAMSCGLACIASDIGGIREAVQNGTTGLLCPPEDLKGLFDSLVALISDKTLCTALGSAARKSVQAKYDIGIIAGRHVSLYSKLLKEGVRVEH